jgi:hypothetical protein
MCFNAAGIFSVDSSNMQAAGAGYPGKNAALVDSFRRW